MISQLRKASEAEGSLKRLRHRHLPSTQCPREPWQVAWVRSSEGLPDAVELFAGPACLRGVGANDSGECGASRGEETRGPVDIHPEKGPRPSRLDL